MKKENELVSSTGTINILKLVLIIVKRWIFVLIFTTIAAFLATIYSGFVKEMYKTHVEIEFTAGRSSGNFNNLIYNQLGLMSNLPETILSKGITEADLYAHIAETPRIIDRIISNIESSLKQEYWEDDARINNKRVFQYESKAVALCPTKTGEIKDVCRNVVDNLVFADALLAETLRRDAENTGVQNPANQECYDEMLELADKAMEDAENKVPVAAISHYMNSWKSSQKAIGFAHSSADICD